MTSLLITACVLLAQAGNLAGNANFEVEYDGRRLDVYTYKPASFRDGPMLMVFHGADRNAQEYRDHARAMGDRFGMLVVAPRFDPIQFGAGMYQQGGLFQESELAPPSKWTWNLVPKIREEVRRREGRSELPCYMIGHSGGGQFLMRMSGFIDPGAVRIVAVNPGSDLFPTTLFDYPYGFGNLPEELSDDQQLRRYLAQPLTLYLGDKDTERDRDLDKSPAADRQGENRFDRGRHAFRAAEDLARSKGWEFRWRLVVTPGVGHDHQAMFDAPECESALFGAK